MTEEERQALALEIARRIHASTSGEDTERNIYESLLAFPEMTATVKVLARPKDRR